MGYFKIKIIEFVLALAMQLLDLLIMSKFIIDDIEIKKGEDDC